MSSNTEPRRWVAWCCAGCAECLDGPPQTPCDSDSEDGRVVVEASAYDALAAELVETLDALGAARMIRDYLADENAALREALEEIAANLHARSEHLIVLRDTRSASWSNDSYRFKAQATECRLAAKRIREALAATPTEENTNE